MPLSYGRVADPAGFEPALSATKARRAASYPTDQCPRVESNHRYRASETQCQFRWRRPSAADRIRTRIPWLRTPVLIQLSYGGKTTRTRVARACLVVSAVVSSVPPLGVEPRPSRYKRAAQTAEPRRLGGLWHR